MLVVKARRASKAQIDIGIHASFEIDVVDDKGTVIVRLHDGTLRKSDKGWWISAPAKKNGEKWYRHWRLYPDKDLDDLRQVEEWVVKEILSQVSGDAGPEQGTGPTPHKTNAPFAGNKQAAPANSRPSAPAVPAKPSLIDKDTSTFPFPTL